MAKQLSSKTLITTLSCILLAGVLALGYTVYTYPSRPTETTGPQPLAGADIGGPFTLVNQDGQSVTEADYQGQYKLIYFGFTFCPAICPTELQKISVAMSLMDSAIEQQITPIFITVDPERDTVETMRDYVDLFSDKMVGLTGSREQINQAIDAYKVYAARVETDSASDYTMDHSSYIYFMGPNDEPLSIFRMDHTPYDISSTVTSFINPS